MVYISISKLYSATFKTHLRWINLKLLGTSSCNTQSTLFFPLHDTTCNTQSTLFFHYTIQHSLDMQRCFTITTLFTITRYILQYKVNVVFPIHDTTCKTHSTLFTISRYILQYTVNVVFPLHDTTCNTQSTLFTITRYILQYTINVVFRIHDTTCNTQTIFSWFCLEIIGCCFGHSKFLRPKQQPLISKQNHENACYAVIIL